MQRVVNLVRKNYSSMCVVASSKLIAQKKPAEFLKNYPKHLKMRDNNNKTMTNRAVQEYGVVVSHHNNKDDDDDDDDDDDRGKCKKGETKQGGGEESSSYPCSYSYRKTTTMMIPKHVAAILDGSRRWLEHHGLDLDYRPLFNANIRFADSCLNWGVPTATSYVYGLGNLKHRSQEATDNYMRQFEGFLEERLDYFMRNGIKISVVGERSMVRQSCQTTMEKVEEATKNNTNLDLMLAVCYTSQRDIVEATKKICNKVQEGTLEVDSVNEDLIEHHLSLSLGGSRPPPDLCIRTGGHLRIGGLLGWQISHVELYFTDAYAPDFGEHVFVDALNSFQHRPRWFGK